MNFEFKTSLNENIVSSDSEQYDINDCSDSDDDKSLLVYIV